MVEKIVFQSSQLASKSQNTGVYSVVHEYDTGIGLVFQKKRLAKYWSRWNQTQMAPSIISIRCRFKKTDNSKLLKFR